MKRFRLCCENTAQIRFGDRVSNTALLVAYGGGENGVPKIIFGNGSQKIWNGSQKLGTVPKKTKLKIPENEVPKIFFKILTFIDYFYL